MNAKQPIYLLTRRCCIKKTVLDTIYCTEKTSRVTQTIQHHTNNREYCTKMFRGQTQTEMSNLCYGGDRCHRRENYMQCCTTFASQKRCQTIKYSPYRILEQKL